MWKDVTVLVADNDEEALRQQEEALESEGFRVLTADSSGEVKRVLGSEQIDIAVLDIRLNDNDDESDTSGLDLAEEEAPSVSKVLTTVWPNLAIMKRVRQLETESKFVYFVDDKAIQPIVKAVWKALAHTLLADRVAGAVTRRRGGGAAPPPLVFISYSRDDRLYKDELCKYLKTLEVHGQLRLWTDDHIKPGAEWRDGIERAIEEAAIAVQLITTNYLNSDFINTVEVPLLLGRRTQGRLKLYPVLSEECLWTRVGWLRELQVRTDNGSPIYSLDDNRRRTVLLTIAEEIADFVADFSI